ncbi:probable transcription repressor OFP9 [Brachypodium distachyon]|uniref:Transcription repressor n=1 Tax=Brachypodium distachyon TaxID=15368 RepID=A0A2K2CGN7_BRADI|nr:probable transcription repressor OFP9 [Brachypodium distachyon]PNT61190.1 hypothetical protein BRADI_5g11645v3 [Brachypodium distachyon]|eukprot:XP_003581285.1 probable transcription repressor OFP9 [Brachypodium distachyon]
MQLFSGRSKKNGGSGKSQSATSTANAKHRDGGSRCRALCCGASTRLSVSSSASCSSLSLDAPDQLTTRGHLSSLAHGMVQARLQLMIDAANDNDSRSSARRGTTTTEPAERRRWPPCSCSCASGGGGGSSYYEKKKSSAPKPKPKPKPASERKPPCVVLVAVDKRTYAPREEFRRSIAEVIAAKRMAEPAELRALLNCYVSVNAREHRAAILEAFHEVCSGLFSCKGN